MILQQYIAQLSSVREDALSKANRQIIIVGCGSHEPIANYKGNSFLHRDSFILTRAVKEITSCAFPIYVDPKRELYHALDMTTETLARTPTNEERRSYLRKGVVANALGSIWVRLSPS